MTPFTSFVAVDKMTTTVGGKPTTISVPVEMPEGVSYEGVFGDAITAGFASRHPSRAASYRPQALLTKPSVSSHTLSSAKSVGIPHDPAVVIQQKEESAKGATGKRDLARIVHAKLAESLHGLAKKVTQQGKEDNLTIGKLRVIDYKVDVMIYLRDTLAGTIETLKKLGFVQTGESKAVHLLIGTTDVHKLEEPATLDTVIHITPVAG